MAFKNENMVLIKGNQFEMGTHLEDGFEDDLEGPPIKVTVKDFYMSPYTVTNADFLEFFQATGYVTEAERIGSSFVFHLLLSPEEQKNALPTRRAGWWFDVPGASWRKPEGEHSTIERRMEHPVVHVSRNDALAYCHWAGTRLPTEAEWEYAARGGLVNKQFPWGDELKPDNKHKANIWQGDFPTNNTEEDGYLGTAPVHTYGANGYGLYQMSGNVWEWCLNPGKIPLEVFQEKSAIDLYKENHHFTDGLYALRGGSFLCYDSYCNRYRVAGRNSNTANSSSSNIGFRVVRDVELP